MYKDYFYINKNFQTSINLELDLNNEDKINEYIPTTDICDVLKRYLKSVLGITNERATTLVGPYGKGKSFLLLVLTYILSKHKNKKAWNTLCKKINKVDNELFQILMTIEKKEIALLPIVINSNYDNITQSFQLALNEALKREKLENLIPKSVYSVCLDLLNRWESDPNINRDLLKKCHEINDIDIKKLRVELSNYSPSAYRQFTELYNCINIGLEFNPLINNDIVKIYSDVTAQLTNHGYSGTFIIFDEFSKFLEGNSSNLMKDLKIIQDFAELCSRSSINQQIHLCCVTHKSLSLYLTNEKKTKSNDSFKTVEGRFSEFKFNRSINENYQIIEYAIQKKGDYKTIVNNYIEGHKDFYKLMNSLNIFDFEKADSTLYKGCFPLNPLTVYTLIQLSEIVAQNERTLFTFLSDSDENSFNSFILNANDGLFNVDKIYDYFSHILQKEETNSIRNTWYRAESILSKTEMIEEKKIIKALAIIYMINDLEKLPPTIEILAAGLDLPSSEVERVVSSLINKHYLRKNLLNNLLSFALSNSKHIDDAIDYLKKTKFKNIRYSDYLNDINEKKYIIPRKYNEQNKITRFFGVTFLSEEEFKNINSFSFIMDSSFKDGLVVNLLRHTMSDDEIQNKIQAINDKRVVIKCPDMKIDDTFYKIIQRYACLKEIYGKENNDEIAQRELLLLIEESEDDAKALIEKYFEIKFTCFSLFNYEGSFNSLLSHILENIFTKRIIFNNELVNKQNVTSQYQKAINHVIDFLLDENRTFIYSETSPETSVKISVIDSNKDSEVFREIINQIKNTISESKGENIVVYNLMQIFSLEPYGIRNGVLPILFAKALSELSDNIILYFQNKEIPLESNNLVKSVLNDKYTIKFSKGSIEQKEYLENMMNLFNVHSQNDFRKDTSILFEALRKYFLGLPEIIRSCTLNNNFLGLNPDFIAYKSIFFNFNINPFETVYIEPQKIFKTSDYKELINKFILIKTSETAILEHYKKNLLSTIRSAFSLNEKTSLKMGLQNWLKNILKENATPILSDTDKDILNCIKNSLSFDNAESLNLLCKSATGLFIEDSNGDIKTTLVDKLKSFKQNIENVKYFEMENIAKKEQSNSTNDLSIMGNLLKNNIQNVINEYSNSVSSAEKVEILSVIISEIIK